MELIKYINGSDWYNSFNITEIEEIDEYLNQEIEKYQDNLHIFPPKDLIFNAFTLTPLEQVKVCIIGQDPYHSYGQAMGLCFSVPKDIPLPPSLKNIYKELKEDLVDFEIPKHGDLTNWAKQGVLLLNASLTVREHCANSHSKLWMKVTDNVIEYLSNNSKNIIFLLWGNFAKNKKKLINIENHHILEANHPSPLSANRGGWFGCKHFSKTNEILTQLDKSPIDWKL